MCHNDNVAIRSYRNKGTRDIAQSENSKEARKILPSSLHQIARRKLAFLAAAESLADVGSRSGLALHRLKRDRMGQHSVRINDQYRICFEWVGKDAELVEITDYH